MITREQERQLKSLRRTNPDHFMAKFGQSPRTWYRDACVIADHMGLFERGPLRILDIGCGFGYFVKLCRELGHTVTGLDVPDKVIERAAKILDVPCVAHTITALSPMPLNLSGYDLITTFGVNFRHAPKTYWGRAEYVFLANDVRGRLRPAGSWVLRPNYATADGRQRDLFSAKWWQAVAGSGACVVIQPSEPEVIVQWRDN